MPFNGLLYVGVEDLSRGFEVLKADVSGTPPYTYQPVIRYGGYSGPPNENDRDERNVEVLSMKEFQGRLYVGGNGVVSLSAGRPAELLRVNADDTWDLVAAKARETEAGPKIPISGMDAGFNNPNNNHMWRMEVFDDNLYVGTFDSSTLEKENPNTPQSVRDNMGFDLYQTSDGARFSAITTTGLDDKLNFGVRSFAATPYGLFIGTANPYYGLKIYRAVPAGFRGFQVYVPSITRAPDSP